MITEDTTQRDKSSPILRGPLPVKMVMDQTVTLRDGIRLFTDIYLPGDSRRAPAVLFRHPYNTRLPWIIQLGRLFAGFGYAAVFQNVRGRYRSEGKFGNLPQESEDGYDVALWLADQPWSDGRLFTIGMSYSIYAANMMVKAKPPGVTVAGLINIVPGGRLSTYRNGALVLHWALPWAVMMGEKGLASLREVFRSPWERFSTLPLEEAPPPGCREYFHQIIDYPPTDLAYWDRRHIPPGQAPCPVLDITGWDDYWIDCVGDDCRGLDRASMSSHHTLIIGPWSHQTAVTAIQHDLLAAGPAKISPPAPLRLMPVIDWLNRCERGPGGFDDVPWPDVRVWTPASEWSTTPSWPPTGRPRLDYYLDGRAGTTGAGGRGRLTPEVPPGAVNSYVYDPDHPVPTLGGVVWAFPPVIRPGPADQAPLGDRQDVLVYVGETLSAPATVLGEVMVELWVSSSAPDTDFTVKLVDVHPDGRATIIADSIMRCRYRLAGRDDAFLTPGEPVKLRFAVGCVSYRFGAGHRVRLDVSSSNFPKFDRNLNTNEPLFRSSQRLKAEQSVYTGGDLASRLELPLWD